MGLLLLAVPCSGSMPEWIGAAARSCGSLLLARYSHEALVGQMSAHPALRRRRACPDALALPPLGSPSSPGAGRSPPPRPPRACLAAGALAWIGEVIVLTGLGYTGLSRFMLPRPPSSACWGPSQWPAWAASVASGAPPWPGCVA